jgi:hypothetical protein
MRILILLFLSLCISLSLFSQTPEKLNYQAVVRDGSGAVIADQQVGVQVNIIQGALPGTVVYTETFALSTNNFGLINLAVGAGTVQTGVFADIDWSSGTYFLNVKVDAAGGSSYTDMGTVQLLSVPYALYAKSAGNTFSGNYNDLTNQPTFAGWDTDVDDDFSGNYNDLTNKPELDGDVTGAINANTVVKIQGKEVSENTPANGQVLKWNNVSQKWEPSDDQLGAAGTTDGVVTGAAFTGTTTKTLTLIRSNGLGDITATFTDEVNDADADPNNELQNLSITGDELSISNGNSVTLPQTTYVAGSGIEVIGNVISNTAQNQAVTLTGSGSTVVTGTYPNYTITSTDNVNDADSSPTNEIQSLNINGNDLSISGGNTVTLPQTVYTAGSGISVSGNQIINIAPDQAVTLTGSGSTVIGGSYPNFTISTTDENTTYQAGSGITLNGTEIVNASPDQTVGITSGTGISVSGTYPNFTIANTNPDQTVTLTGTGSTTITGTYPNYTITSTDNNTTYTAGSGININGSNQIINTLPDQNVNINSGSGINVTGTYPDFTIANTNPDQPVTLTGTGATTVTGSYPNYTINSNDNNTTYTSGTGLTLTGTTFSHNAHSGDVSGTTALTVTGIQGKAVSSNTPANGQILKWNSTTSKWELAEDQLGAAGTNDGVVTSVGVTGTTTKTITLSRSQGLSDLTATFNDEGSVYNAGTGIGIAGSTITNTLPDQTVTLTQGGSTTVTGTYPNFTISSTDNNTTYTAGAGLLLSGTQFTHDSHSGDVTGTTSLTVTGIRGRGIATTAPTTNQVLKYNGTTWAPAIDENTTYSAGTGINIAGTTINNSAPDQTVTLTQGGSTTITGSYPNFTISSTDNNSGGTVTSVASGTGLTGGPITTTGTLSLTGQSLALHNLSTSGIITRTGAGTVAARTITAGNGITLTNGSGVLGNPTIAANFGTTSTTVAAGNHTHSSYGAAGTNGMVQFNNNGAFGGSANLFWDNTNTRLGIGTNVPNGMMVVRQTATTPSSEVLFEVKDKAGQTVFAVYEDSVKIFVSDEAAKANKGVFAVSGRNTSKSPTNEYLRVTPDSVRVFIDEDFSAVGATRGGFAVGGFSAAKALPTNYMNIEGGLIPENITGNGEARILWYPEKEAFLAGRVVADSVGMNSWATGFKSKAFGDFSQAMGNEAKAIGVSSTAIGNKAKASGVSSFAFGDAAEATGTGSYAFGSISRDTNGVATNIPSLASGNYSFVMGLGAKSTGKQSFSIGNSTTAAGTGSFAIGNSTTANGTYSIAIGRSNTSSGSNSVTLGSYNTAGGSFAQMGASFQTVAIGYGNEVTGDGPMGYGTGQSVAIGRNCYAKSYYYQGGFFPNYTMIYYAAIAIGREAHADGRDVFSIGNGTTAMGRSSYAFGKDASVNADYSYIFGLSGTNSYSLTQDNTMAIMGGKVGIGTVTPSSALEVYTDASGYYAAEFQNDGDNVSRYGLKVQAGEDTPAGISFYMRFYDGNGTYEGSIRNNAGTVDLYNNSDIRLKENIINTPKNGLNIVNGIRVVDFNFIEDQTDRAQTGFIAQEMEKVFPDMVVVDPETGIYNVSNSRLVPILTKAIQEQSQVIEELKAKSDSQEQQIQMLNLQMEEIKAALKN